MEEKIEEVLKYEGVFSIVANGEDFPHIANSWNSFVSYENNKLFVPVGIMKKMEEILKKDNRVIVVLWTREIEGLYGMGMGIKILGSAKIVDSGDEFKKIKDKFEWSRAVMIIDINEAFQTA